MGPFVDAQQALDLVATAVFVAGSLFVGVRILALWGRTRQTPELLLGLAMLGTAGVGYPLILAAFILRQLSGANVLPEVEPVTAFGWVLHDLGVSCALAFTWRVFRARASWARMLFAVQMVLLWLGLGGLAVGGFFESGANRAYPFFWLHFVVIWTYPAWGAIESFRYARLMRRRLVLGLADPVTANRFQTWGLALSGTLLATLCASPLLFVTPIEAKGNALVAITTNITSLVGVAAVFFYFISFVPPAWYRRRVEAAYPRPYKT